MNKNLELALSESNQTIKALKAELDFYSSICPLSSIPETQKLLESFPSLKSKLEELATENSDLSQSVSSLQTTLRTLNQELKTKIHEIETLNQDLFSAQEAFSTLNTRAFTLEKMLNEKDNFYQDLLSKYKLLQSELARSAKPIKKETQPYDYEINKLKQALVSKLSKQA